MPTYTVNLEAPEGHGVVLYFDAPTIHRARAILRSITPDDPIVHVMTEPGADVEVRLFLYGERLAKHVEEQD